MSKFKPFLFGALLGSGITVCALQFHVVQSHEGVRIVPRTPQPSLGLAWLDVRNWDAKKWADRPEVVRALVANGSGDLVASSVAENAVESATSNSSTLGQLRDFLNKTPFDEGPPGTEAAPFERSDSDAMDDEFDDMFTLPLPKEVRQPKGYSDSADASSTSARNERVARRQLPDIDDVLGTDVSSMDELNRPAYSREDSQPDSSSYSPRKSGRDTSSSYGSTSSSFESSDDYSSRFESSGDDYSSSSYGSSRQSSQSDDYLGSATSFGSTDNESGNGFGRTSSETGDTNRSFSHRDVGNETTSSSSAESDLLEGMLFGDGSELESEDAENGFGGFDDISTTLENRAESALRRAQNGFRDSAGRAVDESIDRMNRYVRDRTAESVSGLLSGDSATSSFGGNTSEKNLPPALRALREGFDPFVD